MRPVGCYGPRATCLSEEHQAWGTRTAQWTVHAEGTRVCMCRARDLETVVG